MTFRDLQIEMSHGAGGKASRRLIEELLAPRLADAGLTTLDDAAPLDLDGARLALTADSFVVRPLRFPGGSIGSLAVHGTVNDLAAGGARPVALLLTLIIEAGLDSRVLEAEVEAAAAAARRAGVSIVGGDTKVVENGKADGLYVTTAGVGLRLDSLNLGATRVADGDRVLVSGPVGDHGATVLLARGDLDLEADLCSDSASIYPLVAALAETCGEEVRFLRDPTRGGVATVLSELARDADVGIVLDETAMPVRRTVRGICELLGLDPLHIACEGRLVAVVSAAAAESALEALRGAEGGEGATMVGTVAAGVEAGVAAGTVVAETAYGGRRNIEMLVGDPLPRIC